MVNGRSTAYRLSDAGPNQAGAKQDMATERSDACREEREFAESGADSHPNGR